MLTVSKTNFSMIKKYEEFVNEAIDLSFFKSVPILAKALADPFARSLAPEVKKMMDGDINDLCNALASEHQAELLAALGDN